MDKLVFGGTDVVGLEQIDPKVRGIVGTTDAILEQKRSPRGEIIVTLFEQCNLSCKFCNQDHNSTQGMDTIREKLEPIKRAIELLQRMRKESFSIHFMGGELFDDRISQSCFDDYEFLVDKVSEYCEERSIPVEFLFQSNLVHLNTHRVKEFFRTLLIRKSDVSLGTSYDPSMRFSAADLMIFRKNLEHYGDLLSLVNVVLTRPNIEKFLTNRIPHFDYIYEHFPVYFDYYTPEANFEMMSPSDREHRDMFEFLVEKYPLSYPVADWVDTSTKSLSCQSTYTIMPDGSGGRCTVLLNSFQKQVAPSTAGEMEHKFVDRMECMSCEYFAQCGLGCFLQNHFNGSNRQMNYCWMKDVHRKIGEAKNVG